MISYGRQSISDDDVASVVETLRGDWLTQGPVVTRTGCRRVCRCKARRFVFKWYRRPTWCSCAANIGRGEHVVTSPLTFMASMNAARYVGAIPELIDISPTTLNIAVENVPSGKAVIPVHFAGLPVELDRLDKGDRIAEDAARVRRNDLLWPSW